MKAFLVRLYKFSQNQYYGGLPLIVVFFIVIALKTYDYIPYLIIISALQGFVWSISDSRKMEICNSWKEVSKLGVFFNSWMFICSISYLIYYA